MTTNATKSKARDELFAHIQNGGPIPTIRTTRWELATPKGLCTVFLVIRGLITIHNGILWHLGLEDGLPIFEDCKAALDSATALAAREGYIEFDQPFGPVCDRGCVEVLMRLNRNLDCPRAARGLESGCLDQARRGAVGPDLAKAQ